MPKVLPDTIRPNDLKFVAEYVKTGNATESVLEAYPRIKTRTSAATTGHHLLKKKHIRDKVQEALQEQGIDPSWIIKQRKKIITEGIKRLDDVKVLPSDINKSLEGLERLGGLVGTGGQVQNKSVHLHQHLHEAPRKEVLSKIREQQQYFNDILEEE